MLQAGLMGRGKKLWGRPFTSSSSSVASHRQGKGHSLSFLTNDYVFSRHNNGNVLNLDAVISLTKESK